MYAYIHVFLSSSTVHFYKIIDPYLIFVSKILLYFLHIAQYTGNQNTAYNQWNMVKKNCIDNICIQQ